jgi:hypothetical protein
MNYFEVFMQIRQWIRFSWKNVTLPHLAVLHENLKASWRSLLFEYFDRAYFQKKSSLVFENFNRRCASRRNLFSNFVDLIRLANLPWLILQPSVASTMIFYEFPHKPLLFYYNNVTTKNFSAICAKEKSVGNSLHIHLIEIVMQTFRWKSLRGWDSRPQLIVVSGLFGGNPFVGGILGHNLLLSRASFSRWNSGYHEAFLTNFFLFSRCNSGYHEAFLTNFFLFSRWNSGYHKAFLTNFFSFFTMELWLSRFGGRLFSYISQRVFT